MDWITEIKANKHRPIYIFYGSEHFLFGESIRWLQQKVMPDVEPSCRDLTEISIQELIVEASAPSLFGGARLLVGQNATFLGTQQGSLEHNLDKLGLYIQRPVHQNILILTLKEAKLDRRKKIYKILEQAVRDNLINIVEFKQFNEIERTRWIAKQFRKQNKDIEPSAITLLVSRVGINLYLLHQEILKLCTYADSELITSDIVEDLISPSLEADLFNFIDHLVNNRFDQAVKVWQLLLLSKTEPIQALILLARQFRLLLLVKLHSANGLSLEQIAAKLCLHIYPVKLAFTHGSRFSIEKLYDILNCILKIDNMIRDGDLHKSIGVERLMIKLAQ